LEAAIVTYAEGGAGGGTTATIAASNPDTPSDFSLAVTVSRVLTSTSSCAASPGPVAGTSVVTLALQGADYNVMGKTVVAVCGLGA
jgi:hypothetical protein